MDMILCISSPKPVHNNTTPIRQPTARRAFIILAGGDKSEHFSDRTFTKEEQEVS